MSILPMLSSLHFVPYEIYSHLNQPYQWRTVRLLKRVMLLTDRRAVSFSTIFQREKKTEKRRRNYKPVVRSFRFRVYNVDVDDDDDGMARRCWRKEKATL